MKARFEAHDHAVPPWCCCRPVLGLPATITAGFLGMNVIVPVSEDDPTSFWLIAAVVLLFEIALVALARGKRWI
jgi:Mg2+ and Co2+ transporter CorA